MQCGTATLPKTAMRSKFKLVSHGADIGLQHTLFWCVNAALGVYSLSHDNRRSDAVQALVNYIH
jgi:hypothetical protein